MYKYKNISGLEQAIIGVGCVPADAVFTTYVPINNPNFELLQSEEQAVQAEPAKETE
ncbi:MAG TPA: hypothetical protein PKD15_00790 [Candidatus Saccharibacteria bacterium]|nr:hypothetical protein [Candidatus Saccharibacteria bacterium]